MNSVKSAIYSLYRDGLGAVATSLACSVCTFTLSQSLLFIAGGAASSPEIQSVISVSIFIVGYWLVYFAIRSSIQDHLHTMGIGTTARVCHVSRGAKLFFVGASEVFWIVSLGLTNLALLRAGYSAQASAALAQWGINLVLWLPLLPIWEWFATDYLPNKIAICVRRSI
jgi:hypothetical protein